MNSSSSFHELLEAIEHLPPEEQSELMEVIRRRLAERGRRRVISDVNEARAEHAQGKSRKSTVDDLMREIDP